MKNFRYIGYVMVNGDIYRLPNCLHFCLSNSTTTIISSLRENIIEVFNFDFIMDNRFEVLIREFNTDTEQIFDISVL